MPTPTVTEVEEFKVDIDAAEQCVNTGNLTFETRLSGTKQSLQGVLDACSQGNITTYSAAATYSNVTDWVENVGVVYRPIPSNLPIGPEAFDSSKWVVVQDWPTRYQPNDFSTLRSRMGTAGYYKTSDRVSITKQGPHGVGTIRQYTSGTAPKNNNGTIIGATTTTAGADLSLNEYYWERDVDGVYLLNWWEARGDDSTDNTAAITAWISALKLIGGVGSALPGVYRLTSVQDLTTSTKSITLEMGGVTFVDTRDYSGEPVEGSRKPCFAFTCDRTVVKNLKGKTLVTLDSTTEIAKKFAHMFAFGGTGTNTSSYLEVCGVEVDGSWNIGLLADYTDICVINGVEIKNALTTGVYTTNIARSLSISNVVTEGTGDDGVFATFVSTPTEYKVAVFDNITVKNSSEKGVGCSGAKSCFMRNISTKDTHVSGIGFDGSLEEMDTVYLENINIDGFRRYAGIHGTQVSGNYGAIWIPKTRNVKISGVKIKDVTSFGNSYGIYLTDSTESISVEDVRIEGASSIGTSMSTGLLKSAGVRCDNMRVDNVLVDTCTGNTVEVRDCDELSLSELTMTNGGTTDLRIDNIGLLKMYDSEYSGTETLTNITAARRYDAKMGSTTYDPPSLSDGTYSTTTVTVTGAAVGDMATATFSNTTSGFILHAYVSATNTVTVQFHNESGGVADLASGTLTARVIKL